MSLKTAQANFQKAFIDNNKTLTETFLEELREYLTGKKAARYQMLLECMDNGEPLASFLCRNDICDDLVTELLEMTIPFVMVTNAKGEYGFIIRSSDRALTNEVIRKILKRKGTYCEIVTGEELLSIIMNLRGENDKQMLALQGLSVEKLKLLEKLCKKRGILDFIAEDKMDDGTYRFMVHAKRASQDCNFSEFILTMVMMTEGKNKDLHKRRILNELNVQKLRAMDFGRKEGMKSPLYIVGSSNQYIKIEQDRFEFGHSARKNGEAVLIAHFFADKTTPSYKEYETSFLNRIPDPIPTKDLHLVMEHFNTHTGRDPLDFGMTWDERQSYFGEKMLINALMTTVIRKIQNDPIMNVSGRWLEKTFHTTTEAGKVLDGLINNIIPQGYDELDMTQLRASMAEFGMEASSYMTVSNELQNINMTTEKGTLLVKGSIQQNIEQMYEGREQAEEVSYSDGYDAVEINESGRG